MKPIDIAELAKRSGLPASTLRFYEEKGLIESIGRRGLRRTFDPAVMRQLALIALGRAGGFSLDEIAAMFDPDGNPLIDRSRLEERADELDKRIRRLKAMRDGLLHVATCPAESHLDCPRFARLLELAGTGRLRERDESSLTSSRRKEREGGYGSRSARNATPASSGGPRRTRA